MKPRNEDPVSSRARPSGSPPTDLELMMWVDGELGAARASEVEVYLATDPRARGVVESLRFGADLMASHAEELGEASEQRVLDEVMDGAEGEASRRWMAPPRKGPAWRTPAMAAIGLGFAVAAAFFLVLHSVPRSHLPLPDGQGAALMAPPTEGESPSSDDGSIAVIDFGTRPGAVLYLPWDTNRPTAVVWLTDDDAEDTQ